MSPVTDVDDDAVDVVDGRGSAAARGPVNAILRDVPTTVVARSFGGGPVPFGLDRALELRGGHGIGPCGLPSQLPLDWHPELLRIVTSACRERVLMDEHWFTMPPLALDGEHGVGRTHVARQIARYAGLPYLSLDVSGGWGEDRVGLGGMQPDARLPPPPIVALAATGCANPVILLTGVDGTSEASSILLASMVDPRSSERWVDERMRTVIDLSHVNWLVSTEDVDTLHPSLRSVLEPVELETVSCSDTGRFELLALSVLVEVMSDLGVAPADLIYRGEDLVEGLRARGSYACRVADLYSEATQMVLDALRNG